MMLDQNSTLHGKRPAFGPRTPRRNGSEDMQLSIDFDEEDEYEKLLSCSEAVNAYSSLIARRIKTEDDCVKTETPPADLRRVEGCLMLYFYFPVSICKSNQFPYLKWE